MKRSEAEAFIEQQFNDLNEGLVPNDSPKSCWHYGRMDLKALLDKIYGEKDASDD